MHQTIRPERQKLIIILGWYQVIGGAIGIIIFLFSISDFFQLSPLNLLIVALLFMFFVYSILCGLLCIKLKPAALTYSMINQFLQLFSFQFYGIGLSCVAGISFSLQIILSGSINLGLNITFSHASFFMNQDFQQTFASINIVAFVLIYQIDKLMTKIKAEQPEIDLIGNNTDDELI